jgi:hypothetical protein
MVYPTNVQSADGVPDEFVRRLFTTLFGAGVGGSRDAEWAAV